MIASIPGVRGAQAYVHGSSEGISIIDPGYTGSVPAVLRFLEQRGLGPIDWIVLTHHHIDHAGAAFALAQATGARLAVHRDDAAYLQKGRPRNRMTLWRIAARVPARLARHDMYTARGDARARGWGEPLARVAGAH